MRRILFTGTALTFALFISASDELRAQGGSPAIAERNWTPGYVPPTPAPPPVAPPGTVFVPTADVAFQPAPPIAPVTAPAAPSAPRLNRPSVASPNLGLAPGVGHQALLSPVQIRLLQYFASDLPRGPTGPSGPLYDSPVTELYMIESALPKEHRRSFRDAVSAYEKAKQMYDLGKLGKDALKDSWARVEAVLRITGALQGSSRRVTAPAPAPSKVRNFEQSIGPSKAERKYRMLPNGVLIREQP